MYIGPSFPELNALTHVEQMCVARVHPLVQIYSVRTGQVAYVGHVVNLEQKVKKWYDNLPPHPRELPILLISRPTRGEWKIKSRRAPIVVNRERLIAAFERLMISHSEYRGDKRPRFDNIDKYYKSDDGGAVVVDVNAHEPLDCEEAYDEREVSLSWLLSDGFPCASHAPRWVRSKIPEHGEIDLWNIVRRELEKAYASNEPDHPAARGGCGCVVLDCGTYAGLRRRC